MIPVDVLSHKWYRWTTHTNWVNYCVPTNIMCAPHALVETYPTCLWCVSGVSVRPATAEDWTYGRRA
jgi:hypothetical protein